MAPVRSDQGNTTGLAYEGIMLKLKYLQLFTNKITWLESKIGYNTTLNRFK